MKVFRGLRYKSRHMLMEIIKNNKIEIFFQPIVSIKNKRVFAFEALLRAYDNDGQVLSPVWLFEQAKKEELSSMLDHRARLKAIEKFKPYYDENPKLLLFLNFESSSIERNFDLSQYIFVDKLLELGIPFKNIVLEVKEDEIENTKALKNFCRYYKNLGFNIALDDFGTGNSSFDRLSFIMPTVVKIDRSIIHNLDKNYINAEILKAISKMCEKIGALVLAEGVESHAEILECMHGGVDLYQGYWFARPTLHFRDCALVNKRIEDLAMSFLKERSALGELKENLLRRANRLTDKLLQVCANGKSGNRGRLARLVQNEKNVEAVYVIDAETSCQVGDTIINVEPRGFYEPSRAGEDHSLKEYVYMPKISKDASHLTSSYISGASGNICYTFSKKLFINHKELIFCVDIYEEEEEKTGRYCA